MFTDIIYFFLILGLLGLIISIILYKTISKKNPGTDKMIFISHAIREGAMAFLKKEYSILSVFIFIIAILLFYLFEARVTFSFVLGALLPAIAGFVAMSIATLANTRTANMAKENGESKALFLAFNGGAVMGITSVSLAFLGFFTILYLTSFSITEASDNSFAQILIAFGFGSCLLGLFSRVGGGIYTKAADVGADLVGKIEAGIPEDDPRNPAVIADNVGDNVGDIAGMGADIFASYVNAFIAILLLIGPYGSYEIFTFATIVIIAGFVSSLITILIMNFYKKIQPHTLVRYAPIIASLLTVIILFIYSITKTDIEVNLFFAFIVTSFGILSGIIIGLVTEYYTAGKPVRDIAEASKAGSGSNVIKGLSVGMESSFIPVIVLIAVLILSTQLMGAYGIALAAIGMLSTMTITNAIDGYGPITDNAGGIAEMSELGSDVRAITDKLDAVGNTTAAIGKGFAISSTALTAIALIIAFALTASQLSFSNLILASDPTFIMGLLFGGIIIFLFSSLTIKAVGDTALVMVEEVRRQFKTIPGLMEGTATPDYSTCVAISTKASLKKMILPGFITILTPIIVFVLSPAENSVSLLLGTIIGTLITGIFMAFFMSNAGGAWDNAKKYIEAGKLEGHKKGSDAHAAAVCGDTVGDPFKDTSGPSLNIVIKIVVIISLFLLFI